MWRAVLIIAFIAIPAQAVPRLKDKMPSEETRIEELRIKYERLRASGTDAQKLEMEVEVSRVRALVGMLDKIGMETPSPESAKKIKFIMERIEQSGLRKDLYDIEMYDRKKAGGKK